MDVEPVSSLRPTRLRPRFSIPIAATVSGVLLAFIIGTVVQLGFLWDAWWALLPLGALVVLLFRATQHLVAARAQFVVEIAPQFVRIGDRTIERRDVVLVKRDQDLLFKGSRIELSEGQYLRVPTHLHLPSRLVGAFRRHGYPVE
jgi:hypothetical protein